MFDGKESNRVEFKRELTESLEEEVVAFLNYREGGFIYIGIDNDGTILGVEEIDNILLKVKDRLKNNIEPSILGLFDLITENYEEKSIIKIVISSGPEKPYYLKKKGMTPNGCYLRVESSKEKMSNSMINEMYAKRVKNSLKEIPSPRQELTFNQLRIYYDEHKLKLTDNFLKNLDLLTSDGRYNYNAFLLADDNNISLKVVKYLGTDKIDLIENEEYGYRCLLTATSKILDKLDIENKTYAKIEYYGRKEMKKIDTEALREAVINAIVHNDYSFGNSPIIELYSDRIEITSAGGLPQELSQEEFFEGITAPRNKELIRIFKDVELIENIGSGILRILKVYDRSCFKFYNHYLRLSFKYKDNEFWISDYENDKLVNKTDQENKKPDKKIGQENKKPDKKTGQVDKDVLTKRAYKKILILEFCKEPRSLKEIMDYTNLNHRETFMNNYLYPLLESGKIEMTIPEQPRNRNQKYITKEDK